jgi:hypothetical protein
MKGYGQVVHGATSYGYKMNAFWFGFHSSANGVMAR